MSNRRKPTPAWTIVALMAVSLSAAAAGKPGMLPGKNTQTRDRKDFTDADVQKAIDRGVSYLLKTQQDDGSWAKKNTNNYAYPVGPTAICTYALLEAGVKPTHPKVKKALAFLSKTETENTYCYAFRASAYAAAMRYDRNTFLRPLMKDVSVIWHSFHKDTGGYSYFCKGRPARDKELASFAGGPDQSNSQYALLGVWAGSRWGVEVPSGFWKVSMEYWLRTQNADGGWGYSPKTRKESYRAMTLAGLASLYVCVDNLYASRFLACRGNAEIPQISRGLDWVEKNFKEMLELKQWFYYTLYGLERVALATGYKYFAKHDWYKLGTSELLSRQDRDGSWSGGKYGGGPTAQTSYALLFLVRGRRPVLFNKLEFEGDWNNRPRDMANVTRWMQGRFETDVAWQIINADLPVTEWHDAPILYISGSKAPRFTDEQIARLRTFVLQGGTIFSCTECSGKGFREGIRQVYAKMFTKYELTPCGPDHPVYSSQYDLKGRPKLHEISNGVRPLVFHTDHDLPRAWQLFRTRSRSSEFEAAVNIAMYVNGRGEFRRRGTSPWPTAERFEPVATVAVARLKHNAQWNPEPLAYERFARMLGNRCKVKLNVTEPMDIDALADSDAKVAVMTGLGTLKLSEKESAALKAFVAGGGMVIVDAAGGNETFGDSARKQLSETFGEPFVNLLGSGAVLGRKGMAITDVRTRRIGRATVQQGSPRLKTILVDSRPGVIFSDRDITAGLVGYPFDHIDGYMPEDAYRLMRNCILTAAGVSPDKTAEPGQD